MMFLLSKSLFEIKKIYIYILKVVKKYARQDLK